MKTLDLSGVVQDVRKVGAVKALFEFMEASWKQITAETFKGFLAGTSTPVAIYGCVNSGDTTNYNISAGAIWNNGEMFTILAFVGTASVGQVPRLTLVEQKAQLAYTDNTSRDTLITRTYAWVIGTPGSGLGDFAALGRLTTIMNNTLLDVDGQISTAVSAEATLRSNADTAIGALLSTEVTNRTNADTNLQNQINALSPTTQTDERTSPGDGSAVTVLTVATASNKNTRVTSELIARWLSGAGSIADGTSQKKTALFRNVAGVVTQMGATQTIYSVTTSAGSPVISFSISGTDILIRVQAGSGDTFRVLTKADKSDL